MSEKLLENIKKEKEEVKEEDIIKILNDIEMEVRIEDAKSSLHLGKFDLSDKKLCQCLDLMKEYPILKDEFECRIDDLMGIICM